MYNEKISVIIPVHNEQENVKELTSRLLKVITPLSNTYEIIFVDDSDDNTFEIVSELHASDPNIKGIKFSRRFSHQAAICAGLDAAVGACVVMMDGDLQHPPELIKIFVEKWKEGYEIVYGYRERDEHTFFILKKFKNIFYSLMNYLSQTNIKPNAMEFRLIDRKVAETLVSFRERSRFFRGIVSWVGFSSIGIPFKVEKRFSGKSKYSIVSLFKLAADGIFSFSTVPLKITLFAGFTFTLLSVVYALIAVIMRLLSYYTVQGWTSVIVLNVFIGGMIMMSLGVIGEYVGRIYEEVKQRPLYIISKKVGF